MKLNRRGLRRLIESVLLEGAGAASHLANIDKKIKLIESDKNSIKNDPFLRKNLRDDVDNLAESLESLIDQYKSEFTSFVDSYDAGSIGQNTQLRSMCREFLDDVREAKRDLDKTLQQFKNVRVAKKMLELPMDTLKSLEGYLNGIDGSFYAIAMNDYRIPPM